MKNPVTTPAKQRGLFLKGFSGTVLGSLAWQCIIVVAAVIAASSHWLSLHTRHQRELAAFIYATGVALNLWALYKTLRRAHARTGDGILAGFCILFFLGAAVLAVVFILQDVAEALRD